MTAKTTKTVEIAEPTRYEVLVDAMKDRKALYPVFEIINRTNNNADEILTFKDAFATLVVAALGKLGWSEPREGHGFHLDIDGARSHSARMMHGVLNVNIDEWKLRIPVAYVHVPGSSAFKLIVDGNTAVFDTTNTLSAVAAFFDAFITTHLSD